MSSEYRLKYLMFDNTDQYPCLFVNFSLQKNHIYTSGASGTNAAVIRGALRAEKPELLTVILPQSLKKQPPESQELLSKVRISWKDISVELFIFLEAFIELQLSLGFCIMVFSILVGFLMLFVYSNSFDLYRRSCVLRSWPLDHWRILLLCIRTEFNTHMVVDNLLKFAGQECDREASQWSSTAARSQQVVSSSALYLYLFFNVSVPFVYSII